MDQQTCPSGHDLRAGEIPREYLEAGHYGSWSPEDGPQYYSHLIGVEIPGIYDGICYWQCPVDGERWHRFQAGDRRRAAVEKYWK
jgi:hypothetical protein